MNSKIVSNLGMGLFVLVALVGVTAFGWGWLQAGDALSFDPNTLRQKRIEKKLDAMDVKLDLLLEKP